MSAVAGRHLAASFRVAGRHLHSGESPYRYDRVGWAHDCIIWRPDEGLAPYQEAALAALDEHGKVAVVGPHGIGKTAIDALAVLHFAITRDIELVDWKVPTVASAWRQLTRFLWPEIHKWARRIDWAKVGRAPLRLGTELLGQNIHLRTGQAFAVASNDYSSIEGAHADSLFYLLDECRSIVPETWDAIEGAFAGAGTDTDTEAWALANSTPGEPTGRFYDIHARRPGYEDWHTIHVTLDEAIAAGRISAEWADQRAVQWGEDSALYRRRVLGEFAADDADSVVPLAWIEAANDRWRDLHDDDGAWLPKALPHLTNVGVDVARSGSAKTVIACRHGTVVDRLLRYQRQSTMQTTGIVVPLITARGTWAVVDVIGIGAGVVDRLREQDLGVVPFNASERTDWRDRGGLLSFTNKRSAAWWHMRELLDPDAGEDIALPPDDDLLGELVAPKWRESSNGRIQVESKPEVSKRLGRSTDNADAVIQAFWLERPPAMQAPIDEALGRRRRRSRDAVADLNF